MAPMTSHASAFSHVLPLRWDSTMRPWRNWARYIIIGNASCASTRRKGHSPPQLTAMSSKPQLCPISDIPLAARTIANVMCMSYPLISFVYDGDRPPLRKIPCGKSELLSISLYQTVINGLVLTVNDANQKCVGVAVWTGPVRRGFFGRIGGWCILAILYLWLFINMFYYGLRGNRMNKKVNPSCYICQL
jgi:hypothetical protein